MNAPTFEQCSEGAYVETERGIGFATWYPVGPGFPRRAVVIPKGALGFCFFDVYFWHPGEAEPEFVEYATAGEVIQFGQRLKRFAAGLNAPYNPG